MESSYWGTNPEIGVDVVAEEVDGVITLRVPPETLELSGDECLKLISMLENAWLSAENLRAPALDAASGQTFGSK
jgi:hypothetical protein